MPSDPTKAITPLDLVRRVVARELEPQPLRGDDEDLASVVDSMMRVNILLAVEESAGVSGFAAEWPDDRPFGVREIAERLQQANREQVKRAAAGNQPGLSLDRAAAAAVSIRGWAFSSGSLLIPAEQVDLECGFESGFLRDRTGIQAVRRASADEDETSLAVSAALAALEMAGLAVVDVDLLAGVSTTYLGLPSFAPSVHAELLLRESAGALDVGGTCCGVLYALEVAASLLSTMDGRIALVVASEVNSRRLAGVDAPPEFRALFGDAACAFVLERTGIGAATAGMCLLNFTWGASATFASALRAAWPAGGTAKVEFRGEQLAGAAIETLDRILDRLATMSGVPICDVDQFALHEPNPRAVAMLARKAGIPFERLPQTSRSWGNLGSVTCGVNLCKALSATAKATHNGRPPAIFAAAVGPGLLWGGAHFG